jgi:predicted nucleic acid-binding protein
VGDERPRVCLDLNVFVAAEIALAKGHESTTPLRLVNACREGRFDLVTSWPMLERLTEVLQRSPLNLNLDLALERAEEIADLSALPNLLVVGGGILPVRDTEDRGVLETALAGRAQYLATYNLADFEEVTGRGVGAGHRYVRELRILHPRELAAELHLD